MRHAEKFNQRVEALKALDPAFFLSQTPPPHALALAEGVVVASEKYNRMFGDTAREKLKGEVTREIGKVFTSAASAFQYSPDLPQGAVTVWRSGVERVIGECLNRQPVLRLVAAE